MINSGLIKPGEKYVNGEGHTYEVLRVDDYYVYYRFTRAWITREDSHRVENFESQVRVGILRKVEP